MTGRGGATEPSCKPVESKRAEQSPGNAILVFGGFSTNNKGDHAMLVGLLDFLRETSSGIHRIVYSTRPDLLREHIEADIRTSPEQFFKFGRSRRLGVNPYQYLLRLRAFARGLRFFALFQLYRSTGLFLGRKRYCKEFFEQLATAKAVVFSGGGYLNSIWWLEELYAKYFIAEVAHWAGIPVLLTSQGIGPFTHPLDRRVAARLFRNAELVGVRDGTGSISQLQELGAVRPERIFCTGDDACLLSPLPDKQIRQILQQERVPEGKLLVAFNFRDGSRYTGSFTSVAPQRYARILDSILSLGNIHGVFIPVSYNSNDDDRRRAEEIIALMKQRASVTILQGEYGPDQLKSLVGSMHLAIGTSYHFNLFALSGNVPAIGLYNDLYYRKKLTGLFSMYEMNSSCYSLGESSLNEIEAAVRELLERRNEAARQLMETNLKLDCIFRDAHARLAQFLGSKA